jgi:hypothetical protein
VTTLPRGAEMFAAMLGGQREPESETHPIDPLAQAMELRDRFRRAMIQAPLEPGMLCTEKRGMGILTTARLVMFWRWLDPAVDEDAAIIDRAVTNQAVHHTDCMVGFLDENGSLRIMDFESWRLEPCDAAYPEDAT